MNPQRIRWCVNEEIFATGMKKLWTRKYPDMCGRDQSCDSKVRFNSVIYFASTFSE